MKTSILIQRGLILDPDSGHERVADISIIDGGIVAIGQDIRPEAGQDCFDADSLWVAPAFIDLHAHLREIGQSDRETIDSGTKAAAFGGYGSVLAMANTDPPIDSPAMLSLLLDKIDRKAHVEVLPAASVTKAMAGAELTEMVELAEMGVAAFSDDGLPINNLAVLRRALEYARLADRPIISHAEDRDLAEGGLIHEGLESTRLGMQGIPAAAEAACVAREIEVVRQVGGRLHFAHISCAASVESIRSARADGLPITADATPHHISLCVDDIKAYDTSYKMNPPLRTAADQAALIAGLKDGTIDAIATDHAPHTRLDKSKPFDQAPFGVIGLETAFPLALERLFRQAKMGRLELISLFTTRAAAVLGLPQPGISPGRQANLVMIDPEQGWIYDASKGFSKSSNSPFHGHRLTGKVLATFCRGRVAYKDEELISRRLTAQARAQ